MKSIWSENINRPCFESLKHDLKTDVLIIGGGMTGILCAYMLHNAGVNYLLAESGRICDGITKNTTAKITFGHGLIYSKLINMFGREYAKMYLDANRSALDSYRKLCENIECDIEEMPSFVYSRTDAQKIQNEVSALKSIGFKAELVKNTSLPFSVAGAVKADAQAQFHPLKFAFEIAKSLNIAENTKISGISPEGAITDKGVMIFADKIIVATHFPFINKHGSYFLKMYQHRSYVLALKNAQKLNGMYVDDDEKGLSFRNSGDLLLLGGGSHRTGKKGGCWQELESVAKLYYPRSQQVSHWATQDCMTLDGVPYIGKYSKRTQNLYVATGFNKWGMTSSMVAANILKDELTGSKNPYAPVFLPSRTIMRAQLAVNAAEAVINLLTPTVPRCPHLGCALKYNKEEHTWDCPCHGSRFTQDGKLLDNPATGDKKHGKFEK